MSGQKQADTVELRKDAVCLRWSLEAVEICGWRPGDRPPCAGHSASHDLDTYPYLAR